MSCLDSCVPETWRKEDSFWNHAAGNYRHRDYVFLGVCLSIVAYEPVVVVAGGM